MVISRLLLCHFLGTGPSQGAQVPMKVRFRQQENKRRFPLEGSPLPQRELQLPPSGIRLNPTAGGRAGGGLPVRSGVWEGTECAYLSVCVPGMGLLGPFIQHFTAPQFWAVWPWMGVGGTGSNHQTEARATKRARRHRKWGQFPLGDRESGCLGLLFIENLLCCWELLSCFNPEQVTPL